MADIRFEHVTKRFGSVYAVNDFNLSMHDREFLTLVGPSGCGKSTTLNLLAGLEDPSEGLILIDDKVVNDVPPSQRDIAMVFQSYALYPHMTVRQNIGFGLKVRGMEKTEIERRVQEAARVLGIGDLLDRKPGELSGGQRQRVALGRAITRDPKVFLLDEPLSNLDAKLRIQMRADLKILFERLEGTVVYVTHDQAEAMTLSDRLVVMNHGLIQQLGTPLEVYDHPNNIFVAGFLGSPTMNFVDCEVRVENDAAIMETENFRWALGNRRAAKAAAQAGKKSVFGVRPEDVTLHYTEPARSAGACCIEVIEHMGSINYVYVNTGSQRIVASSEAAVHAEAGDTVYISFDDDKVHLFDYETTDNVLLD
jgi:multiple sugar transport system ATP-binding protein